jgi:hypothetical protein
MAIHCNLEHLNCRYYNRLAQPGIADFAEFVLIVRGRKPAFAPETALWEVD